MAWQLEIASESSETEESCECKIRGSDQSSNDSFPNIEEESSPKEIKQKMPTRNQRRRTSK